MRTPPPAKAPAKAPAVPLDPAAEQKELVDKCQSALQDCRRAEGAMRKDLDRYKARDLPQPTLEDKLGARLNHPDLLSKGIVDVTAKMGALSDPPVSGPQKEAIQKEMKDLKYCGDVVMYNLTAGHGFEPDKLDAPIAAIQKIFDGIGIKNQADEKNLKDKDKKLEDEVKALESKSPADTVAINAKKDERKALEVDIKKLNDEAKEINAKKDALKNLNPKVLNDEVKGLQENAAKRAKDLNQSGIKAHIKQIQVELEHPNWQPVNGVALPPDPKMGGGFFAMVADDKKLNHLRESKATIYKIMDKDKDGNNVNGNGWSCVYDHGKKSIYPLFNEEDREKKKMSQQQYFVAGWNASIDFLATKSDAVKYGVDLDLDEELASTIELSRMVLKIFVGMLDHNEEAKLGLKFNFSDSIVQAAMALSAKDPVRIQIMKAVTESVERKAREEAEARAAPETAKRDLMSNHQEELKKVEADIKVPEDTKRAAADLKDFKAPLEGVEKHRERLVEAIAELNRLEKPGNLGTTEDKAKKAALDEHLVKLDAAHAVLVQKADAMYSKLMAMPPPPDAKRDAVIAEVMAQRDALEVAAGKRDAVRSALDAIGKTPVEAREYHILVVSIPPSPVIIATSPPDLAAERKNLDIASGNIREANRQLVDAYAHLDRMMMSKTPAPSKAEVEPLINAIAEKRIALNKSCDDYGKVLEAKVAGGTDPLFTAREQLDRRGDLDAVRKNLQTDLPEKMNPIIKKFPGVEPLAAITIPTPARMRI